MTEQLTFAGDSETYFQIFYREIQADSDDLEDDIFVGQKADNIEQLLQDVFSKGGGSHTLRELQTSGYFERWVTSVLDASANIVAGDRFDDSIIQHLEDIAENFSESMRTRARQEGKYVVLIVGEGRLIICHSYTGKKALTTDMKIIEELLSADNIDKYAEFYRQNNEIRVDHFEKHATKSFVEWLGIPEDEVIFDIRGNVKVHSEVAGIGCVFQFERGDLVEKIIQSDEYSLKRNVFRTPDNEPDYSVEWIQWGNDTYEDSDTFLQEALTIHFRLSHYDETYDGLMYGIELFNNPPIDREDEVIVRHENSVDVKAKKTHEDFEIVFANQYIELQAKWAKELAEKFLEDELVPIYHPGHDFLESEISIGNFRIYNDIGLTSEHQEIIDKFVATLSDQKTSNLRPMFSYILFEFLQGASRSPIRSFFGAITEEFEGRMASQLSNGTRYIQNEGTALGVEFKPGDWLEKFDNDWEIVKEIAEKFDQGHRLFLCGFDEGTQTTKLIPSNRLKDERIEGLQDSLREEYERAETAYVMKVPIGTGTVAVAAFYI